MMRCDLSKYTFSLALTQMYGQELLGRWKRVEQTSPFLTVSVTVPSNSPKSEKFSGILGHLR
jgi:hypothetical protein